MAKLDEERVEALAKLAHLALTDEEKRRFGGQLQEIVSFAERIQALDTSGVAPTSRALLEAGRSGDAALRDDTTTQSLERERVLDGAPDSGDGLFKVPRVLP